MRRGETGRYEVTAAGSESVRAFVPNALPPVPALALNEGLQPPLEAAAQFTSLLLRRRRRSGENPDQESID